MVRPTSAPKAKMPTISSRSWAAVSAAASTAAIAMTTNGVARVG
jgi:hypothetical protein